CRSWATPVSRESAESGGAPLICRPAIAVCGRKWQWYLVSGGDFSWIVGECADQFAEIGLLHTGLRLGRGQPGARPLLPLRPLVGDVVDFERKDMHLAAPFEAGGKLLAVVEAADLARGNAAGHAGL